MTRCARHGQGFLNNPVECVHRWGRGGANGWDSKAGFSVFTQCSGNQHLVAEENALLNFLLKFLVA